jgi:hypothetical protein
MLAANIYASRITVDTIDSINWIFNAYTWGGMQLGPDGKLYANTFNSSNYYLGVINYPDSAGTACNAVHGGIVLPNYHYNDLPNIPLYELGPLVGSGCDTITGSPPAHMGGATEMRIYPNPVLNQLTIGSGKWAIGQTVTVAVYDILGKVQLQQTLVSQGDFKVDVSSLSSGIYMLQLKQEDRLFNGRFVKE